MLPVSVSRSSSDDNEYVTYADGAYADAGHWRIIHRDSPGGEPGLAAVDT